MISHIEVITKNVHSHWFRHDSHTEAVDPSTNIHVASGTAQLTTVFDSKSTAPQLSYIGYT